VDAEIIGVTRDGKYADLDEAPQPYLYPPLSQDDRPEVTLIVTTAGDAGELFPVVRKALQQRSPNTLIINTQTLTDHMRFVTHTNRMAVWLTASHSSLSSGSMILERVETQNLRKAEGRSCRPR
jgi:hypothetical protein